jgi:hypothetical protein
MAQTGEKKVEPKVILLGLAVVLLVALAVWQGSRTLGTNPAEQTFVPKVETPADGEFVRSDPGVPTGAENSGDKLGSE